MSTWINKLNDGFDQATTNNLPEVDFAMVIDFIEKSVRDCGEIQGSFRYKINYSIGSYESKKFDGVTLFILWAIIIISVWLY